GISKAVSPFEKGGLRGILGMSNKTPVSVISLNVVAASTAYPACFSNNSKKSKLFGRDFLKNLSLVLREKIQCSLSILPFSGNKPRILTTINPAEVS
ncbi:MAG: hypothetical protein NC937_06040, partial [Candidatus Omnitrophica bacterium]|nr:hypothetical protein [Candidatus Omnitrophota bacterium]